MAFIEEWRGCQDYDGSAMTLQRRPCYTNARDAARFASTEERTDGSTR